MREPFKINLELLLFTYADAHSKSWRILLSFFQKYTLEIIRSIKLKNDVFLLKIIASFIHIF